MRFPNPMNLGATHFIENSRSGSVEGKCDFTRSHVNRYLARDAAEACEQARRQMTTKP